MLFLLVFCNSSGAFPLAFLQQLYNAEFHEVINPLNINGLNRHEKEEEFLAMSELQGSVIFVRLQELTRNGRPTYEAAIRDENLPFAENTKEAQPAEWGVAKIANVSRERR